MKKLITVTLILLLAAAVVWNRAHQVRQEPQGTLDLATIQKVFPGAERFEFQHNPFPLYAVYQKGAAPEKPVPDGYAFLTTDLAPHVMGYAGPIVMLVGIDPSHRIQGICVLESHETSAYAYGIEKDWWLKQFIGLGPKSNIAPEGDIDAISSATVTVSAVCRAVRESLQKIAAADLVQPKAVSAGKGKVRLSRHPEIYFLLALFLLSLPTYLFLWNRLRTVLLVAGFLYLGIKLKMLFSVAHVTGLLDGMLPDFEGATLMWIFLALIILTGFVFGRVYCGYACPFGALQEFIYKISPWRMKVNLRVSRRLARVKYYLLWLLAMAALLYPALRVTNYETFALTFTLTGPLLVWYFTGLTLVFSFFIERFYCRYFCFAGACLGILNHVSLSRIDIDPNCSNCYTCERICSTGAIHGTRLDTEECILCNRCRRNCPKGKIKVRFFKR